MTDSTKVTTLEIKDILAVVRRRKWLIVLPVVLVAVIAFGGSYLLEKRYQSSTMVVIDQTKFLTKQLQALVPGQEEDRYSDAQRKSRLIAIHNEIISSSYLSRLIGELNLAVDPETIRKAQKLGGKRPDVPVRDLVYYILIQELRDNIKVDFNGENIIEITAEASDPLESMKIATKLAEIFKEERLKQDMTSVRGALDFSDEQLAVYRRNLDEAERRKADFVTSYLQNQLDESVTADTNIRTIMADVDNIKGLIDDNIKRQAELRTRLGQYKKAELELKMPKRYDDLTESVFTETERLADLMSKYTWSDPKVINASLRISSLIREMESLVEQQVDAQFSSAPAADKTALKEFFILQSREMVFRQKLNDFEVALSTLRSRIAQLPQYEIQLRNLDNEVSSARVIYEKFKDQLTGSEISQSLMRGEAESKYRIMEPASMPMEPVKPNHTKITILGVILGIIIGGVAALLAELLDNSFRKVEDVEAYLHMSVLATIPTIPSIKGKVKVK